MDPLVVVAVVSGAILLIVLAGWAFRGRFGIPQHVPAQKTRGLLALLVLGVIMGLAIAGLATYRSGTNVRSDILLLIGAGAILLVGWLLGFLYGLPRSSDTYLEQIADWLTKILVGVGLAQLTTLPDRIRDLGVYFAPLIGGPPDLAERIAVVTFVLFVIGGFLIGYIWTRVFLGPAVAETTTTTSTTTTAEGGGHQ